MSYIDKIFPVALPTVEEIETKYKNRSLIDGQKVTRFAPSPTGSFHIGGLYAALISQRVAHQSKGVFFLRIEDTDTKREVEGAADLFINSLNMYDINPNEGAGLNGSDIGEYGPYRQSQRKEIYQSYIKELLIAGKAYVCFTTSEELDEIRKHQEVTSARMGYYGKWAKSRNLPVEIVEEKLNAGDEYVIRLKSDGDYNKKITIKDNSKGSIDFPENDLDVVIMKKDKLPTYHFAHVVDDHLMQTTDVLRGDEWIASLPLHMQMFRIMGWKAPRYTHFAPIQKLDEGNRRKLSKRKDPEAGVVYYDEVGYPKASVIEYLLNLANSNFEDWRKQNPTLNNSEFNLTLNKLSPSGSLFDFVKLNSVSKEVIAKLSVEEMFDYVSIWADEFDSELKAMLDSDSKYVKDIFSIERVGVKNVRKDFAKWSEVKEGIGYFFDDKFANIDIDLALEEINRTEGKEIVSAFVKTYNPADTKEEWFAKMLEVAEAFGYAKNGKVYKAEPEKYKGDVSAVVKIFRILLTGKPQSPDLYSVMNVMGKDRVMKRLSAI